MYDRNGYDGDSETVGKAHSIETPDCQKIRWYRNVVSRRSDYYYYCNFDLIGFNLSIIDYFLFINLIYLSDAVTKTMHGTFHSQSGTDVLISGLVKS